MHCHFTHHIMNQMGHEGPNVIGMDSDGLDTRIRSLLPGYMTMGQTGMAGMAEMGMPVPDNSIAMKGAPGKPRSHRHGRYVYRSEGPGRNLELRRSGLVRKSAGNVGPGGLCRGVDLGRHRFVMTISNID